MDQELQTYWRTLLHAAVGGHHGRLYSKCDVISEIRLQQLMRI